MSTQLRQECLCHQFRAVELQEQAVKLDDRPVFRTPLDLYKSKLAPTD